MGPKKKGKEPDLEKLEPEEGLQHENLNLNVEREEIFTRMAMLNNESKKFKKMYLRLEAKYDEQTKELEDERSRGLQDRNDADKDRMTLELEVKTLKESMVRQQEQNDNDRSVERKTFEDNIKILDD